MLAAFAIRRPVTVAMFTLAAVVFGLVLFQRIGFNLLPELSYPTLTIRTEFPGAAPAEVENLVSRPLEEALGTLAGLRQVRSVSKAGQSDVYLEFYWGSNMDLASLDAREKMDQVQLPLEIAAPTLLRFNPNNDPIVRLSLSATELDASGDKSDVQSLVSLRRYADNQLSRRLQTIDGVAAARASGGFEDEIQVRLDPSKLAQLNLTVADVAERLKSQNVNLSAGQIRSGQQQLLVRTFNEFASVEEIGESIVLARDQRSVRLNEIADIAFTQKDPTAIIRHNGQPAVEIALYKEGDANIVQVANDIEVAVKRLQGRLPDTMKLESLTDASTFIEQAIDELLSSAVVGGLLAMLIIYCFLGTLGPTLIISLTIPLSVIITFNFMYMSEIDINIMSLGGLALAVGMLVDNAIVVLENIARKREEGLPLNEAAATGASEVTGAISASTLTTIAVFLPISFVSGIAGELFRDQALTITYSLVVSLAVAVSLIPMLAARRRESILVHRLAQGVAWVGGLLFKPLKTLFLRAYERLLSAYQSLLAVSLRHSVLTLLVAFGLLGLSLLTLYRIPQVVLPEIAQGQINVRLVYPPGVAIEATDQYVARAAEKIAAIENVTTVFATAGVGNRLTANPEQGGDNEAELILLLSPGLNRNAEEQVFNDIRRLLAKDGRARSADAYRPELFSFSSPLTLHLVGFDSAQLQQAAATVLNALSASDTFVELNSNVQTGYPEARVVFDQAALARFGIPPQAAADAVVNGIRGNNASRYRLQDQQIDILVRLANEARDELDDLRGLIINPNSAKPIPLAAVARLEETLGPSEITRVDQRRVAIIEGQIQLTDLAAAINEAKSLLADVVLPAGVDMEFAGQSEEMERSFESLAMALALAIFLVYLVMASQFESLLHPFIILFSVPLALIGALLILWLSNTPISVMVFLGLIMLAGIVVNNAIVLVDRINQLRNQGLDKLDAIAQAAQARFRPILMTTLTTTLGMLPLALGLGEGAELRAPLAITVTGGLLASTLLTLLVVPAMYQLVDRKQFVAGDAS